MSEELKDFGKVTYKELFSIVIVSFFIGIIMNVYFWYKQGSMLLTDMVLSFIFTFLAALIIFLIRLWAQKKVAAKKGYITAYTIHKYTLPASIFLTLFFYGFIPYVSTGDLKITISKRLRLGSFRYGLNYKDLALIGLAAPVSTILLMILIKPIYLATGNGFIHSFVQTAAAITICGLLPINGQEGFSIFFYRRWLYVIAITFAVVYFFLILAAGVFSYVVAAIIALLMFWIYQQEFN